MSGLVSTPPMVHLSESDRSQGSPPTPLSKEQRYRSAIKPAQIVSLGRQINEAYGYRAPNEPDPLEKDTDSMSDATSATYSRSASVQEPHLQNICPPTFSGAPEAGRPSAEYLQGSRSHKSRAKELHPNNPYIPPRDSARRSNGPVVTYTPPEEGNDEPRDHALWILAWLSLLDPLYSLVGAIYAIFTLIVLVVLTPIRLCDSTSSARKSTIQFLSPILSKHLRLMHADTEGIWEYRAGLLIGVYLLAPLVSFGVAIAAWVSASFWVFAMIMGNPDGTERGDDGRNAILGVRNWWARYLMKAMR